MRGCGSCFEYDFELKEHIKTHGIHYKYKCQIDRCLKTFDWQYEYIAHVRREHPFFNLESLPTELTTLDMEIARLEGRDDNNMDSEIESRAKSETVAIKDEPSEQQVLKEESGLSYEDSLSRNTEDLSGKEMPADEVEASIPKEDDETPTKLDLLFKRLFEEGDEEKGPPADTSSSSSESDDDPSSEEYSNFETSSSYAYQPPVSPKMFLF
jgi:uncharacterized protein YdcH (DUF465 family)